MGYRHIDNLYRDQSILMFRECWASEKIHGTSAHVAWKDGRVLFHSGGEKHSRFVALFDQPRLTEAFAAIGHPEVIVYGEAYGGSQQKQAWRYGDQLRFVAFEVQVGDAWLSVPNAHDVATKLGIEFVHYRRIPTDLAAIDAERDAPSEQSRRNGVQGDHPREGVVLRPIEEVTDRRGNRIMAKHKRDEERETATPRKVVDPSKAEAMRDAEAIAQEWVTPTRLDHVLDKLKVDGAEVGIDRMRDVISAMMEDVFREGAGEIVDSREARSAVGRRTAEVLKERLKSFLRSPRGGGLMPPFVQAPRQPTDGPVAVNRNDDDTITIIATTDGIDGSIRVSEYNAARLFGLLALMLGVELPSSLGKAIKF